MTTLLSAAYNAVSQNEVSGNSAIAYSVRPPLGDGTSGWTIGFNQEDFYGNPSQAQATLEGALQASGLFNNSNSITIAEALTTAATSTNPNPSLSGAVDVNGHAATIASVNSALQTTAAKSSISSSSLTDFTDAFDSLETNVFGNSSLLSTVQSALADATQGPLLEIILADYNNQYPGGITSTGPMMTLLTTGSATFNGDTVTLDTATAATIAQSVMTAVLSTYWVSQDHGANACNRLATDVSNAVTYDSAQGASLPGNMTISSSNGTCTITPATSGTGYTGTWTNGSVSGTSSSTGNSPEDVGGTNNTLAANGFTYALSDDALSTLRGGGNAVGVGNNADLTIGSAAYGNTTNATGSDSTVNDGGTAGTVNSSGSGATIAETGTGNTITQSGGSGSVTFGGSGNSLSVTGNSNTITVTGSNENTTITGSSDGVTVNSGASNGGIIMNGGSANVVDNGDMSVTVGSGVTGDGITMNGADANITVNGNSDSVTVGSAATGVGVYMNGNSENVTNNASGVNVVVAGSSDGATINGNSENTTLTGSSSSATVNGNNDGVYVDGAENLTLAGSNDGALVTGSGDGIYLEGSHNTVGLDDASENASITGTNDGTNIYATGDNASMSGTDTSSYADTTTVLSGETVTGTATAGSSGALTVSDNASGNYSFSGSATLSGVLNDSFTDEGTYVFNTSNFSAGGSEAYFLSPASDIIDTAALYTGANDTGELSSAGIALSPITFNGATVSGIIVDDFFTYNGSGAELGFQEDWYVGGTDYYANFAPNGTYISGNDTGLDDDGDLGDGGEFELAQTKSTGSSSVNIANFDATLPQNNSIAAQDAQTAISEINLITQPNTFGPGTTNQALYEGPKWSSGSVITWSFATSNAGNAASPFSSYMGAQYAALVEKALQAWGAASGLTFQAVADSSQSDIRIGWGDFNTTSSGVVGYTTYTDQAGQLLPNVIIRMEDPSQTALATGTNGALTYSGINASLYQVILHEIGHALGLADNTDPNSVMYYNAGPSNTTLDSSDVAGMQTLYGSAPASTSAQAVQASASTGSGVSVSSMLQQMIQANASFLTQPGSVSSSLAGSTYVPAPTLLTANAVH